MSTPVPPLFRSLFAAPLVSLSLALVGCEQVPVDPDGPADPTQGNFSPAHCSYEPAPSRSGTPAQGAGAVRAGVGEASLDMPVGTPLGGYTARAHLLGGQSPDARKTPYARAFAPSAGVQSRPLAKALFLEVGGEPLVLIKMDVCGSFDRLVYDLETLLSPKDAPTKFRGKVIVATSHTHSGWATYQGVHHLALGFDFFQEPQYQRLLSSLAEAGKQAIATASEARLGAGIWDGWDPADEVFSDRRAEIHKKLLGQDGKPIGPHKDNRLLVLRVEDKTQRPLALLFHFPMHGTIGGEDNPLASVDSTGHVELAMEERFENKVMVMHLQGPGGDASPRGRGGLGSCDSKNKKMICTDFARMESLGELAAPRLMELWNAIETAPSLEMEVATRAVPNGRNLSVRSGQLRYAPYDENATVDSSPSAIYDDAGKIRSPITQFNVPHGAGLCGDKASPLPVTGIEGAQGVPYGSCKEMEAATRFVSNVLKMDPPKVPTCETTRTTLSAMRLSQLPVTRRVQGVPMAPPSYLQKQENLLFVTLPGEPVSLLADALRSRSPAGFERTFVIGYAQGHVGYLLHAEDWLAGGYEPSINIYGPLEGEWLMERSLELSKIAYTNEREDAEARANGQRYDRLIFQKGTDPKPSLTPGADPGQVLAQIPMDLLVRSREIPKEGEPAQVIPRVVGRAHLVWTGGDPGEDFPLVTLEREDQGSFVPVVRRSGRTVSSRGKEMIVTYTPSPMDAAPAMVKKHIWAVEWQALGWDRGDESVGLAGALSAPLGRYRLSVKGRASGKDYTLQSRPFALSRDEVVKVSAMKQGDRFTGRATYPVGAGYRLLRLGGQSDGEVPLAGMITVRIQGRDGTAQELRTPATDGKFDVQPSGINLAGGATVTVRDQAGNSGVVNVQ